MLTCEICHRATLEIPVLHQFATRIGTYCPACAEAYGISDNFRPTVCGCRSCLRRLEEVPA